MTIRKAPVPTFGPVIINWVRAIVVRIAGKLIIGIENNHHNGRIKQNGFG
jgi:hypothetical protein